MKYSFLKTIIFKSSLLFLRNLLQTVYFKNTSWGVGKCLIGPCEDFIRAFQRVRWLGTTTLHSSHGTPGRNSKRHFGMVKDPESWFSKERKKGREERKKEAGERGKKEKDQRRKEKEKKKRKTWGSGTNPCTDDQLMNISTVISNRRKNNKQWIENGFCCLPTGFSHSLTHSSCPPWSPCPIASEQCGCPCSFLLPHFIQQVLNKPGLGLGLRIQGRSPKQRMGLPSENFHSPLSFQGCPSWDVTSSSPAYYSLLPTSPDPWPVLQENSLLLSVLRSQTWCHSGKKVLLFKK